MEAVLAIKTISGTARDVHGEAVPSAGEIINVMPVPPVIMGLASLRTVVKAAMLAERIAAALFVIILRTAIVLTLAHNAVLAADQARVRAHRKLAAATVIAGQILADILAAATVGIVPVGNIAAFLISAAPASAIKAYRLR
jgi:hypothetical protein